MSRSWLTNSGKTGIPNIYSCCSLDGNGIDPRNNLAKADIILLKDQDSPRNEWPMGIVQRVFPSKTDECVKSNYVS